MVVDFRFKKAPAMRVVAYRWTGPWKEARIRSEFRRAAAWARAHGLRTGRWVFVEPKERTWEVAVEVRGRARSADGFRVRTLPATRVASVEFDPDEVSPRVVYHGITDWLRWRRKENEIRGSGPYREVYAADPWANAKAWAHTEIQVVVR